MSRARASGRHAPRRERADGTDFATRDGRSGTRAGCSDDASAAGGGISGTHRTRSAVDRSTRASARNDPSSARGRETREGGGGGQRASDTVNCGRARTKPDRGRRGVRAGRTEGRLRACRRENARCGMCTYDESVRLRVTISSGPLGATHAPHDGPRGRIAWPCEWGSFAIQDRTFRRRNRAGPPEWASQSRSRRRPTSTRVEIDSHGRGRAMPRALLGHGGSVRRETVPSRDDRNSARLPLDPRISQHCVFRMKPGRLWCALLSTNDFNPAPHLRPCCSNSPCCFPP